LIEPDSSGPFRPAARQVPDRLEPSSAAERARSIALRLLTSGRIVSAADGSTHDVATVAISAGESEALARLVLRERATRTLEIGLGYGVSALSICEALVRSGAPDARHVALDPFQSTRFGGCGLQVLGEAGVLSLVEHHAEISQIVLPRFLAEGRRFEFALVDGNHRFDSVFVDLFYLGRLLRKGSLIVLDDYDLPGIRRAVSFFLANLGWRVEEESRPDDEHRWVAVRTASRDDARHFRYFIEF
jgi:predicted O-methyltransferase YrrM